jgi:hypothetical protein
VWGEQMLQLIKPTPENFESLGAFRLKMCPWSHPALAGGKMFVRHEEGVVCYDLRAK